MKRERAQRQPACFPVWSSVDKLDSKLLTQLDLAISSGFPPRCTHDTPLCLMTVNKSRFFCSGTYKSALSRPIHVQSYRFTFADAGVVGLSIERGHVTRGRATPPDSACRSFPWEAGMDHRFRTSSRSAVPQRLRTRESPHAEVKDSLRILFLFIHPLSRPALVHGPPAPHSRHACPSLASVRFLPACGSAHARFEAVRRRVHL